MRRLIASVLALGLLTAVTVSPVAAVNICTDSGAAMNKIVVAKHASGAPNPGTGIDFVRGDVTIRDLDVCVGTAGEGGTFVLPANVENMDTGTIHQLGYGQFSGDTGQYFVYVKTDGTALKWPISSWRPQENVRYRFSITRWFDSNGIGRPKYVITNLSTGVASQYIATSATWSTGIDSAWWGAEALEHQSDHGSHAGSPTTIISYMGYSTDESTTVYFRSGLTSSDIIRQGNPGSNHHGHITTWDFGNDALQIETH